MRRNLICAIALTCLTGCASLDWPLYGSYALLTAEHLAGTTEVEAKNTIAADVHARYQKSPTAENLLAVVVTYATPGHKLSSTVLAREFLQKIDHKELKRPSQQLANWLDAELAYHQSLEDRSQTINVELQQSRDALARAQEKIRILTRIEETIGPGKQSRGGGSQ